MYFVFFLLNAFAASFGIGSMIKAEEFSILTTFLVIVNLVLSIWAGFKSFED